MPKKFAQDFSGWVRSKIRSKSEHSECLYFNTYFNTVFRRIKIHFFRTRWHFRFFAKQWYYGAAKRLQIDPRVWQWWAEDAGYSRTGCVNRQWVEEGFQYSFRWGAGRGEESSSCFLFDDSSPAMYCLRCWLAMVESTLLKDPTGQDPRPLWQESG